MLHCDVDGQPAGRGEDQTIRQRHDPCHQGALLYLGKPEIRSCHVHHHHTGLYRAPVRCLSDILNICDHCSGGHRCCDFADTQFCAMCGSQEGLCAHSVHSRCPVDRAGPGIGKSGLSGISCLPVSPVVLKTAVLPAWLVGRPPCVPSLHQRGAGSVSDR